MRTCVSIVERTLEAAVESCGKAEERGADLVEIRFDFMDALPDDLTPFKRFALPKIATLRPVAQGGRYERGDEERTRFFRRAMRAGFDYIDLESDSSLLAKRERDFRGAKVICSYHDFDSTPETAVILETLINHSSLATVSKAAYKVGSVHDLLQIVQAARLYSSTGTPFVLIGMGELGELTRMCTDRMGCAFTYASLEKGKEAAPGQVDVGTLKALGTDPIFTGITGHPLAHTLSPAMHNAAFAALGIAGRYFKLPAREEELEDLLDLVLDLEIRGLNVTIPHKERVMEWLEEVDPVAQRVGAVNTIVNSDGKLLGMNTDVRGIARSFQSAAKEVSGKRALVIGAGGAARACCEFLSQQGADITIANRTAERAMVMAKDFSAHVLCLDEAAGREFDVVVNCTPLGMEGFPDQMPISPSVLRPGQTVMDMVYNPRMTRFLAEAEARGASIIPGMEMLIYQAMDAFEAWTGQCTSYEVMASAARNEDR